MSYPSSKHSHGSAVYENKPHREPRDAGPAPSISQFGLSIRTSPKRASPTRALSPVEPSREAVDGVSNRRSKPLKPVDIAWQQLKSPQVDTRESHTHSPIYIDKVSISSLVENGERDASLRKSKYWLQSDVEDIQRRLREYEIIVERQTDRLTKVAELEQRNADLQAVIAELSAKNSAFLNQKEVHVLQTLQKDGMIAELTAAANTLAGPPVHASVKEEWQASLRHLQSKFDNAAKLRSKYLSKDGLDISELNEGLSQCNALEQDAISGASFIGFNVRPSDSKIHILSLMDRRMMDVVRVVSNAYSVELSSLSCELRNVRRSLLVFESASSVSNKLRQRQTYKYAGEKWLNRTLRKMEKSSESEKESIKESSLNMMKHLSGLETVVSALREETFIAHSKADKLRREKEAETARLEKEKYEELSRLRQENDAESAKLRKEKDEEAVKLKAELERLRELARAHAEDAATSMQEAMSRRLQQELSRQSIEYNDKLSDLMQEMEKLQNVNQSLALKRNEDRSKRLEMEQRVNEYENKLKAVQERHAKSEKELQDAKQVNVFLRLKEAFEALDENLTGFVSEEAFLNRWIYCAPILGLSTAWVGASDCVVTDLDLRLIFNCLVDKSELDRQGGQHAHDDHRMLQFSSFIHIISEWTAIVDVKHVIEEVFQEMVALAGETQQSVTKQHLSKYGASLLMKRLPFCSHADPNERLKLAQMCVDNQGRVSKDEFTRGALAWTTLIKRGGIVRAAFDVVSKECSSGLREHFTNVSLIREQWDAFVRELGLAGSVKSSESLQLFIELGSNDVCYEDFHNAVLRWAAHQQRSSLASQAWRRLGGDIGGVVDRSKVEILFEEYASLFGLESTSANERKLRFESMRLSGAYDNEVTQSEFEDEMLRWMEQKVLYNSFTEMFEVLDEAGEGAISMTLLKNRIMNVVTEMDLKSVTVDELTSLFEIIDSDGDGVAEFSEFTNGMIDWVRYQEMQDRFRRIFALIDRNNDGTVSRIEFLDHFPEYAGRLGIRGLEKDALPRIFDAIDADHSESLNLEEFMEVSNQWSLINEHIEKEIRLFTQFDDKTGKKGYLTKDDLLLRFNEMSGDYGLSAEMDTDAIDILFRMLDSDGDGRIYSEDYHDIQMKALAAMKESKTRKEHLQFLQTSPIDQLTKEEPKNVLSEELDIVWNALDADGSGSIGLDEMRRLRNVLAQAVGVTNPFKFSAAAVYQTLIEEFGDGSGQVTKASFAHLQEAFELSKGKKAALMTKENRLKYVDVVFDTVVQKSNNTHGSASISVIKSEITMICRRLHFEKLSIRDWNQLYVLWDSNNDGFVTLAAFKHGIEVLYEKAYGGDAEHRRLFQEQMW